MRTRESGARLGARNSMTRAAMSVKAYILPLLKQETFFLRHRPEDPPPQDLLAASHPNRQPQEATKSREFFGPDDAPYTVLEKLGQAVVES